MKKDDGIVKKTQEVINDKVVPAAKEGLGAAGELLGKGATVVGEFLKEAGSKTKDLVSQADDATKDFREDAGKTVHAAADKVVETKNDAFDFFKRGSREMTEKAQGTVKKAHKEVKKNADEAVDFAKTKGQQLTQGKKSNKKVVAAVGVAVAAAAAAGAYAFYRARKERDESVKAEFSEKMKKWNELEGEELVMVDEEDITTMHVRPSKIYRIGQNAQLGDDIIVQIGWGDEEAKDFNPDDLADPVNPLEEFRKKAGKAADLVVEKTRQAAEVVTSKAKEVAGSVGEKASQVKERVEEEAYESGFTDGSLMEELKEEASAKVEAAKESAEQVGETIQKETDAIKEDLKEATASLNDSVKENHLMGEGDKELDSADEVEPKSTFHPAARREVRPEESHDLPWEEDESLLMKKTEDVRKLAADGIQAIKEKLGGMKRSVSDRQKAEENDSREEEALAFVEEFNVTIHNRGNKDYFFSPMLIQRYNSSRRTTRPVPGHEKGTTLSQRLIKPGETYTGRIAVKKTLEDDALIMFEDMLMQNSVAILLEEDVNDSFLYDESMDLRDDLLFEDSEDLDELDFEGDDLVVDEAEELDLELEEEEKHPQKETEEKASRESKGEKKA
ncbi:hypothetical protein ABB02_00403 [Clostridiaceae bacterium JG1575]|nr:hypothetical protein ABB02_00403 [Clostridiaceae bacterium JG1575]